MTIEFPCQNCLQPLRVPDTSAGKSARCPKCKALTPVPAVGGLVSGGVSLLAPLAGDGLGVRGGSADSARPAYPAVQQTATPAPTTPPAQPSANDALFAMLKAATTPQPLAPQPSASPFADPALPQTGPASSPIYGSGDGLGSPSSNAGAIVNPYASPAEAYASQTALAGADDRPGLPWEVEGPGIMSWWKTSQMCLSDSSHAFRLMRREGGIGSPLMFAVCGMMIGFAGQMLWQVPFLLFNAFAPGNAGAQRVALTEVLIEFGGGALVTLLFATFGVFVSAAIYHVALMAFGGARQSYETTYRVVAFTHGALAWLQVVPFIGGCIIFVMHFVCLINGLAQAHETTLGKAAAAVFLPLALCGAAAIALVILIVIAVQA